ncbi:hypothetical protein EP7_000621 [Isosphaeraceae bacterium EP7]
MVMTRQASNLKIKASHVDDERPWATRVLSPALGGGLGTSAKLNRQQRRAQASGQGKPSAEPPKKVSTPKTQVAEVAATEEKA